MKNIARLYLAICTAGLILVGFSCGNNTSPDKNNTTEVKPVAKPKYIAKPPGIYQDTLTVKLPAAIFYGPDSLQLNKMKELLDTNVYNAMMHSYFYQVRYAHITLKAGWPRLRVIEAKHYRYLLFIKKDFTKQYVDLDKQGDSYGLFVFNGKTNAIPVDMTNAGTQVSFYLK